MQSPTAGRDCAAGPVCAVRIHRANTGRTILKNNKVQEAFGFILLCHLHVQVPFLELISYVNTRSRPVTLTVSWQLHNRVFFRSLKNTQSIHWYFGRVWQCLELR